MFNLFKKKDKSLTNTPYPSFKDSQAFADKLKKDISQMAEVYVQKWEKDYPNNTFQYDVKVITKYDKLRNKMVHEVYFNFSTDNEVLANSKSISNNCLAQIYNNESTLYIALQSIKNMTNSSYNLKTTEQIVFPFNPRDVKVTYKNLLEKYALQLANHFQDTVFDVRYDKYNSIEWSIFYNNQDIISELEEYTIQLNRQFREKYNLYTVFKINYSDKYDERCSLSK